MNAAHWEFPLSSGPLASVAAALVMYAASLIGLAAPSPPPILLVDRAPESGIGFRLEHHPTDKKHLVETMPGGLAAFDYNGDDRTDLYFTNGASLPGLVKTSPAFWNRCHGRSRGR